MLLCKLKGFFPAFILSFITVHIFAKPFLNDKLGLGVSSICSKQNSSTVFAKYTLLFIEQKSYTNRENLFG